MKWHMEIAVAAAGIVLAAWGIALAEPVRVGLYENRPALFTDEKGEAAGVFVDVVEDVAAREGWRVVFVRGKWTECLRMLAAKEIDLLPAIAFSQERGRKYDFTEVATLENWGTVFTGRGRDVERVEQLRGDRIAYLPEDIHFIAFRDLARGLRIDFEGVPADTYDAILAQVAEGIVDAGITNRFVGILSADRYGVNASGVIFNPIKVHFASAKGLGEKFLLPIDRYLVVAKEDKGSAYHRSLERWLRKKVNGAGMAADVLKWGGMILLFLVVGGALWMLLLKERAERE